MIKRCIIQTRNMKTVRNLIIAVLAASMLVGTTGCKDDAVSRKVAAPEIEESNAKRIEYIDSLQISDAQKQAMKERIGKPKGADSGSGNN
jgi:hypothetical protein